MKYSQTPAGWKAKAGPLRLDSMLIWILRRFNKSAGFWLVAVNFELWWVEANKISVERQGDGFEGGDFL